MFEAYAKHFQTEIPLRPGAKYAHIIVLRRTESYAVFKTDGELNTARVSAGLQDKERMARLTIFKRKQSTPERLTGRELLRRYGAVADCEYNVKFCGECADCVLYGYAIGDTGSEKSKVYVDTAYSLGKYDDSHETMTLNAPFEDGTMTRGSSTTNRFSEQDHVLPEVYFPSVVTLRDPTQHGLAYVINNLRRTKLYGAQTTRTGHVYNQIFGIIFADGEIFSDLRLVQAVHDLRLANESLSPEGAVIPAAKELVKQDGVVYELVEAEALADVLNELDATFTEATKLEGFLKALFEETKAYAKRVGESAKNEVRMHAYHLTITLDDFLFYASRELGRMYLSEPYLHNYALSYALGLTSSAYHDEVQVPNYKRELEPLNEAGVYVTPAKPIKVETASHTFKFADTRYHVKMEQSSVNVPGFGRIREVATGSIFEAFVLSNEPRRLPRWIRLGKWLSKASVTAKTLQVKEADSAFTTLHPLNRLDVPAEPLLYDLINMPPVSLIDNVRFKGKHYILLDGNEEVQRLPRDMRYNL